MVFNNKKKDVGLDRTDKSSSKRYRIVRFIYALLAISFLVCIVLQVFFAGAALFSNSSIWKIHTTFVDFFAVIPLVMFLISFIGGIRGRLRWISLGLYALNVFQYMTIHVFSNMDIIAALHPIVALLLFSGSLYVLKRSWSWVPFSEKVGYRS